MCYPLSINTLLQKANLHFRPYSRKGFLNDLAECSGIISNAGFVLIAEALNLGKKSW
jgi:hypothetical protein